MCPGNYHQSLCSLKSLIDMNSLKSYVDVSIKTYKAILSGLILTSPQYISIPTYLDSTHYL